MPTVFHPSHPSRSSHPAHAALPVEPAEPADPANLSDPADLSDSPSPAQAPFHRAAPARDARSPLLSPRQMRPWQLHHQAFAAALATRLSLLLRADLTLALAGIQVLPYQSMTESWPDPAHFTLFKTEPLRGVSILRIPAPLGLSIVDRLMGGSGRPASARQEMGAIENALLEQVAQVATAEWCGHAAPLQELKPVLLGQEANARYLQTAPPQAPMLLVALDASLDNCREQIHLAFPFAALEPLLRRLAANSGPRPHAGAACPLRMESLFRRCPHPGDRRLARLRSSGARGAPS